MSAAEYVNKPVAADHVRNGVRRTSKRSRRLALNPREKTGYTIKVIAHLPITRL